MEIMKRIPNVFFEMSVDHGVIEADMVCDFEAKHRTVIGLGKVTILEDEVEKINPLDRVVAQFTDKTFEYPKPNLKGTAVMRIDIQSIKGKKQACSAWVP